MRLFCWGLGVTSAGIFALIGFVLWDRRTALAPAVDKIKAVEEREELSFSLPQSHSSKLA